MTVSKLQQRRFRHLGVGDLGTAFYTTLASPKIGGRVATSGKAEESTDHCKRFVHSYALETIRLPPRIRHRVGAIGLSAWDHVVSTACSGVFIECVLE